jgi:hypothetical protein
MTQPDQAEFHRQTAMQCNNRAWELSIRSRTPAEDREMLDAAHTAAWHWRQIGTEINIQRANMLLAEAHALVGHGTTALTLAEMMRDFFLGREDTPDWERAFAHVIYAHAAFVAGERETHRQAYRDAETALAAIADEEDRKIVLETFQHVPQPE